MESAPRVVGKSEFDFSKLRGRTEKTIESLPDRILVQFDECAVQDIFKDVVKHYSVAAACLALESPEDLKLKACYGIGLRHVAHNSIAKHGIARDLPIIIEDVKAGSRFVQDPLVVGPPSFSFFVVTPLMITPRRCVGSLCIMDHACRSFTLQDATFLDECAKAICEIYRPLVEANDLWKFTVSSLRSLDSTSDAWEEEEDLCCGCERAWSLGSLPEELSLEDGDAADPVDVPKPTPSTTRNTLEPAGGRDGGRGQPLRQMISPARE